MKIIEEKYDKYSFVDFMIFMLFDDYKDIFYYNIFTNIIGTAYLVQKYKAFRNGWQIY